MSYLANLISQHKSSFNLLSFKDIELKQDVAVADIHSQHILWVLIQQQDFAVLHEVMDNVNYKFGPKCL